MRAFPVLLLLWALAWPHITVAQGKQPRHGERPERLAILDAIVIDGVGTPAEGPFDIFIEGNQINRITPAGSRRTELADVDAVIDAAGKYVLPGFINMHAHHHPFPAGKAMPLEYQHALWLGAGITTVRDLGSPAELLLEQRELSEKNEIAAPRILAYLWFPAGNVREGFAEGDAPTAEDIQRMVRDLKKMGADGMKVRHFDRDSFLAIGEAAEDVGLRIAHHVGVKDATAWDDAAVGTSTIEHWYGVPDAAIIGVQNFPPDFNHGNELHRFRYAGRIWREADPDRLEEVLKTLVNAGVAWDPTFSIYEACRDLEKAITQLAFRDYLHPSLEAFFTPNPNYHGSFFYGWTHTDEVYWKENYKIWMKAVRRFADLGGVVTTGEDAGYIYKIYGFGYLRELQLHEEAGFHPLEVIKHATYNGAKTLGMDDQIGRVKTGHLADLVVVNGNPLENLQILLPKGLNPTMDAQRGDRGGIEWTIKDGIPYHGPTLFARARELVQEAR